MVGLGDNLSDHQDEIIIAAVTAVVTSSPRTGKFTGRPIKQLQEMSGANLSQAHSDKRIAKG